MSEQNITEQADLAAKINGAALTQLPEDLYIPPDALQIFLEAFEGPLDLLLYLIKKHDIDILDIPIAEITRQYVSYVDLMQELQLELASDYLLMAATLAEIKSRLMLPRQPSETEEEGDPRAELVRRLQEYERFKDAAVKMDELPRQERDIFPAQATTPPMSLQQVMPNVDLQQLFDALKDIYKRCDLKASHFVKREPLSIRERMTIILDAIGKSQEFLPFVDFFNPGEGKMGVVVTFVAMLELIRQSLIELSQSQAFAPIYIKTRST